MYLLYVDDSGDIKDASQQFFVLGGVALFERQPHWIAEGLDRIAARFNAAEPWQVELHGSPMLQGKKEWRQFPLPDRVAAIKDALSLFSQSHVSNCAFAAIVKKALATPRDPVELAFEQLASRFDQFLMRLHRKGDTQRGLMIFDKSTRETTIQSLAIDFKRDGHSFGQLRNMSEVPVFIDSRASRLVQLADLIAYAAFRKYDRGDDQFFKLIEPRFDREGGQVHGLFALE
ncbi:MAG: DUF3800 domain-containing protein [Planctomycetes bacterium]|nr:DUF3800 domain-containing protein [Planctomycetota bacterium]